MSYQPTFTKFAVTGAGKFGSYMVQALIATHPSIRVFVLTRGETPSKANFDTSHAQVTVKANVDYSSAQALSSVLKETGAEVVISTFGVFSIKDQEVVVDAAKACGCAKVFVPSEFGTPTDGAATGHATEKGFATEKMRIVKRAQDAGLACLRIYNGFWAGDIPWMTGFTENGKINAIGQGDSIISYTAIEDVAGFTAYVLTHLPISKLDTIYRIEGDRTTLRQVASVFNTSLNSTDVMPGQMSELRTGLGRIMESGMADVFMKPLPNSILGSVGGKVHDEMEKSNDLWEGHAFLTVADVHGKKSAGDLN
jgi:uncharacterized protein YbjT (DUF2867 family)